MQNFKNTAMLESGSYNPIPLRKILSSKFKLVVLFSGQSPQHHGPRKSYLNHTFLLRDQTCMVIDLTRQDLTTYI